MAQMHDPSRGQVGSRNTNGAANNASFSSNHNYNNQSTGADNNAPISNNNDFTNDNNTADNNANQMMNYGTNEGTVLQSNHGDCNTDTGESNAGGGEPGNVTIGHAGRVMQDIDSDEDGDGDQSMSDSCNGSCEVAGAKPKKKRLWQQPIAWEMDVKNNECVGDDLKSLLAAPNLGKLTHHHVDGNAMEDETLRFFYQNVNGFPVDGTKLNMAMSSMKDVGADVFGFVETKHNNNHISVRRKTRHSLDAAWNSAHHRHVASCSNLEWREQHKPGGTLSCATGNLIGRVRTTYSDEMGRWSGFELVGKCNKSIHVLTCYRVCQLHATTGTRTSYHQQRTMMDDKGIDPTVSPRDQFDKDLCALVKSWHSRGDFMILMGDFNEQIGDNGDGMMNVLNAGQLVDVIAHKHGNETFFSTYDRGSKQLDYILVSHCLLPHVVNCGAEPFDQTILSDHRGLFLDLSKTGLFDNQLHPLALRGRRVMKHDSPKHHKIYVDEVVKQMNAHNIADRAAQPDVTWDECEQLDAEMTEAMLLAEKKVAKSVGQPMNKALSRQLTIRNIYNLALKQKKLNLDMSTQISDRQRLLDAPVPVPDNWTALQKLLRQSQQLVRELKSAMWKRTSSMMDSLIEAKQKACPDENPIKFVNEVKNIVKMRKDWNGVPRIKARSGNGISSVKVPVNPRDDPKDANTVNREVTDPDEMDKCIRERNVKHFKQAEESKMATSKLVEGIGFGADGELADPLLKGEADLNALTDDPYVHAILDRCKQNAESLSCFVSLEAMTKAFKNKDPRKSASPSGRGWNHCSILFTPSGAEKDDPDWWENKTDKEMIFQVHNALMNLAIKHATPYQRWCDVILSLLEKKPGDNRLCRTRVIHIYEADWSLLLQHFYRELTHKLEDQGWFNDGCFGSRITLQALDEVLLMVAMLETSLFKRHNHMIITTDAKACYDRILPHRANLLGRSNGLHKNVAKLHGELLRLARFRTRTNNGVSETSYSHSAQSPVYGTGQGSTASPHVWLHECSQLFDIHGDSVPGCMMEPTNGGDPLEVKMVGFVDDCHSHVNDPDPSCSRSSLIEQGAKNLTTWNGVLRADGGALELDKSDCVFYTYGFTDKGHPVLQPPDKDLEMSVLDHTGATIKIKQRSCYNSERLLGAFPSPTANQQNQFEALMKKAEVAYRALLKQPCNRAQVWYYYRMVFHPSVTFPFGVSHLTPGQLRMLQQKIVPLVLNRLGFASNFPRKVVFAPLGMGGLGFLDLVDVHGIDQVTMILRNLRTMGVAGKALHIALCWWHHNAGVGFFLLEHPKKKVPQAEGYFLTSVRQFLARIDGSIRVWGDFCAPLQRECDQHLMEIAMDSDKFKPVDMKVLNFCRLALGVHTVSDIANATGTHLACGRWNWTKEQLPSWSKHQEVRQPPPNKAHWRLWRRLMQLIADPKGKLKRPLGRWLVPLTKLRRTWVHSFSHATKQLFSVNRESHQVLQHMPLIAGRFNRQPSSNVVLEVPADAVPVDVQVINDSIRLAGDRPFLTVVTPSMDTFEHFVQAQPSWLSNMLPWFESLLPMQEVVRHASDLDNLLLVSDGGAKGTSGSFGWVLGTRDGVRLAHGKGMVTGRDPKSYRAEFQGCRSGLTFLVLLLQHFQLEATGQLLVYLDNQGVVKKTAKLGEFRMALAKTALHSEWDMLATTNHLLDQLPVRPILIHVKGHQDDNAEVDLDSLSLESQMNIEADALASEVLLQDEEPEVKVPVCPHSRALLDLSGVTVNRHIRSTMMFHIRRDRYQTYVRDRFKWTVQQFQSTDSEFFCTLNTGFKRQMHFFSKFVLKKLPVNERLHRWDAANPPECPLCQQVPETDDHLFGCNCDTTRQFREDLVEAAKKVMDASWHPQLTHIVVAGLKAGLTGSRVDINAFQSAQYVEFRQLLHEQNAVGWDHFLRGRISKEFIRIQEEHAECLQHQRQARSESARGDSGTTSKTKTPSHGMLKLLRLIWKAMRKHWLARNDVKHGKGHNTHLGRQETSVNTSITELWGDRNKMLPVDRDSVFTSDLKCLLDLNLEDKMVWLRKHQRAIRTSIRKANRKKLGKSHSIRPFLIVKGHTARPAKPKSSPEPEQSSASMRETSLEEFYPVTKSKLVNPCRVNPLAVLINDNTKTSQKYPDHPS